MRGYNRNKYDLAPYVARTLSGSETAAKIAAGDPAPVSYSVRRYVGRTLGGTPRYEDVPSALPVNLRRAEPRK